MNSIKITNANPPIDNVLIYKGYGIGLWINGNSSPDVTIHLSSFAPSDPIGISLLIKPYIY